MGTSRLPAPFEPNPTLQRSPLPSQCPTERREGILPHSVCVKIYRVIKNVCRGFNNLSYTIHLR